MFKKLITLFSLLAALAIPTLHAEPLAPDAALRQTVEKLQADIKANYKAYRADTEKFFKAVDEVVVPRFDAPYITKLVLGVNNRTATDEQRKRFNDAFKTMLVRSYANSMLDNYDSVKVNWEPVRLAPGATDAVVNTTLSREQGKPFSIGFRVHLVDGDWKVYDINVENLSLITNFRTQLNAEIKRTSLDAVIARMESGEFNPQAPAASANGAS